MTEIESTEEITPPGAAEASPETARPGDAPALSAATLSANLIAELSGKAKEETTAAAPAEGQEPSPEAKAAAELSAKSAEENTALDLGKWGLPKETADQIQEAFGKALGKKQGAAVAAREKATAAETALAAERDRAAKAEVELAKLKGEAAKPAAAAAKPPVDLIAEHPAVKKLREEESELSQTHQWARGMLKVMARDPEEAAAAVKEAGVTAPEDAEKLQEFLETIRDNALARLGVTTAKRELTQDNVKAGMAQQSQVLWEAAVKEYPWHADKESPEHPRGEQLVASAPWLLNLPNAGFIIGDLVTAQLAREARQPKAATPAKPAAAPAKPSSLPGATRQTPAAPPGGPVSSSALFQKYMKSGKAEDKAAWQRALSGEIPMTKAA